MISTDEANFGHSRFVNPGAGGRDAPVNHQLVLLVRCEAIGWLAGVSVREETGVAPLERRVGTGASPLVETLTMDPFA